MREFIEDNFGIVAILIVIVILAIMLTLAVGFSTHTKSYQVDGDRVKVLTDSNNTQYVVITDRGFLVDNK